MNIIVIFTYGISLKDWHKSGLYNREMYYYQNLEKIYGISFTFITFGDYEDYKYFQGFENSKILPVYTIIKKSKNKIINFLKSIYFAQIVSNQLIESDLIKTNQLSGSWIGIIIKRKLKKPLVIRTGYNIYEFKVKDKKPYVVAFFYKVLTKLSLRYSDLYIVTSLKDKNFIEKFNKRNSNVEIVSNWVPKLHKNKFEDRYDKKILSVGRLEHQKNYITLLENMKEADFELDIVGVGSEENYLKKFALKNNLKVNFLGKKDFNDLSLLYSKYKVFVSTSLFEGNPKTILEAMSSGCCVVVSNIASHAELVEESKNGFLIDDYSNMNSKIQNILDNKNLFINISNENYKKIKNNYLVANIAEKEIEMYKKLVK